MLAPRLSEDKTMLALFMSIAGGVSWGEVLPPLSAFAFRFCFLFLVLEFVLFMFVYFFWGVLVLGFFFLTCLFFVLVFFFLFNGLFLFFDFTFFGVLEFGLLTLFWGVLVLGFFCFFFFLNLFVLASVWFFGFYGLFSKVSLTCSSMVWFLSMVLCWFLRVCFFFSWGGGSEVEGFQRFKQVFESFSSWVAWGAISEAWVGLYLMLVCVRCRWCRCFFFLRGGEGGWCMLVFFFLLVCYVLFFYVCVLFCCFCFVLFELVFCWFKALFMIRSGPKTNRECRYLCFFPHCFSIYQYGLAVVWCFFRACYLLVVLTKFVLCCA